MSTTRTLDEVQVVGMFKSWAGVVDKVNTEMKKKGGALHRSFTRYEGDDDGQGDWKNFRVFVHNDRLDPHCTWLGQQKLTETGQYYESREGGIAAGMEVAQVQHNDRPDRFGVYTLQVHRAPLG
jgi:hypothetical protein